jgi:hypothetical protein
MYSTRYVLPDFHTYYPNLEERRRQNYAKYSYLYWKGVRERAIAYRNRQNNTQCI